MSFDNFYSEQLVRYADIGIPVDEFGLPDMGSASRSLNEKASGNVGYGKQYGYPFSGPSMGDGYGPGPAEFLPQDGRMQYAPYAAYALNAGANSLIQGLNTPLETLLGPHYIKDLPGIDMTDVGPDGGEYLQNNSRLDTGYGNRFERGSPYGRDGEVVTAAIRGDADTSGFNEKMYRAERLYRDQYGNSRAKGDTSRLAGPMRNPTGGRRPGEIPPKKKDMIEGQYPRYHTPKVKERDNERCTISASKKRKSKNCTKKVKTRNNEGFSVTGYRGMAPYAQPLDRTVNLYPESKDDYHLETQLVKGARLRKQGGNLVDQETTIFAPNPRSKDYVFNNKHGKLKVPNGFSMTSGTTITFDGDYGVNSGSTGMPHGGVTSGLGAVGNQYTGNNVGGGEQGYAQVDAHPYIGYIPREKTVIQGGNNTSVFYERVDSRKGFNGMYYGPPPSEELAEGDASLVNSIGGELPRDCNGNYSPIGIPSMFSKPNVSINNFHRNIRFIKDNPQVTELYGSNTFELMSNGLHSGHRQHGITASSKKNIVGEQFNDRIVDLRFGNGTPYQYALTNGPGSTRRGIYLDMEVIKAVRPVVDYIFYLKTKGKIQPDMTDDFYFVTEEQYFSVQPLDEHIVFNCLKKYNTGMIDVFKFLNYVFQFYFKHDKMTWSDFKIYSGYIDSYVKKHYGRTLL